MTTKLEAAARHALEALEYVLKPTADFDDVVCQKLHDTAITALREALAGQANEPDWKAEATALRVNEQNLLAKLAEQPALLAANKDLQNHFDALMNDYKKLSALCSSQGTRLMEYESSHEPESKPWVGLTRDERMSIINRLIGQDWVYALDAIEAKLKEKNA